MMRLTPIGPGIVPRTRRRCSSTGRTANPICSKVPHGCTVLAAISATGVMRICGCTKASRAALGSEIDSCRLRHHPATAVYDECKARDRFAWDWAMCDIVAIRRRLGLNIDPLVSDGCDHPDNRKKMEEEFSGSRIAAVSSSRSGRLRLLTVTIREHRNETPECDSPWAHSSLY